MDVGGDIVREKGAKPVEQMGMGAVTPEEIRDDAVSPVGDFIALVGGFAVVIFAVALKWYSPRRPWRGAPSRSRV